MKGELKTRFLKIDLPDGKAPTIVHAITTHFESVDLSIDHLRSLASVFVTLQQEVDPTAVSLCKVSAR